LAQEPLAATPTSLLFTQSPHRISAGSHIRPIFGGCYGDPQISQSSGKPRVPQSELKGLQELCGLSTLGFVSTGGVLVLSRAGEKGAGGLGVADGGLGVEAEDGGEV
jgi:hypothetical protein